MTGSQSYFWGSHALAQYSNSARADMDRLKNLLSPNVEPEVFLFAVVFCFVF